MAEQYIALGKEFERAAQEAEGVEREMLHLIALGYQRDAKQIERSAKQATSSLST